MADQLKGKKKKVVFNITSCYDFQIITLESLSSTL